MIWVSLFHWLCGITRARQRRRWLNGAFFALMYLLLRFTGVLFKASHSWLRKLVFCFQFAYLLVLVVLNWLVRDRQCLPYVFVPLC